MGWIRRKSSSAECLMTYKSLDQSCRGENKKGAVALRKGYVPMLVGREEEGMERLMVHVKVLSNPGVAELLETAASEFGYRQSGILRVPCAVGVFREMIDMVSKAR